MTSSLRALDDAADVLNDGIEAPAPQGDPIARSAALVVEARSADAATPRLAALAGALRAVDPVALPRGGGHRGAFWINVYNALVRHAVFVHDLRAGARVPLTLFGRAAYRVGGRAWTLNAIEHGILRRDRPVQYTFWRPFGAGDARRDAMVERFDARVHFALNCAAASCPPIRAYSAAGLDGELAAATASYVAQETTLDRAAGAVRLPYLTRLYGRDFGDAREALRWVKGVGTPTRCPPRDDLCALARSCSKLTDPPCMRSTPPRRLDRRPRWRRVAVSHEGREDPDREAEVDPGQRHPAEGAGHEERLRPKPSRAGPEEERAPHRRGDVLDVAEEMRDGGPRELPVDLPGREALHRAGARALGFRCPCARVPMPVRSGSVPGRHGDP